MMNITKELTSLLNHVQQPGSFYASGKIDAQLFGVTVDGVGQISLPLLHQQATELINIAEQAPFGKGEETIVDTTVRNTRQIAADQIHLTGKHWQTMLNTIVASAIYELGVTTEVDVELYKLLVYETGGFFVSHRDTEKSDGMFATLIIGLPSVYTGGELRIEHAGQSVLLDFQNSDASELFYAAFYADCVHEVLPVSSGCRLVLVYNLSRHTKGTLPKPPDYRQEQEQVILFLRDWTKKIAVAQQENSLNTALKLVYLLEHAYTPDGLSFANLKNGDQAIAEVVVSAAKAADCEVFLALLTIEESGSAEGVYYDYRRHGKNQDDVAFDVVEVIDDIREIKNWIHPEQGKIDYLLTLPFFEEELCLPERLLNIEPDEQYFHEATGNEGASFERTYRRAALVLFPRTYYADVLMEGSNDKALSYLKYEIEKWQISGAQLNTESWHFLSSFASRVIDLWSSGYRIESVFNDLLNAIMTLQLPHLVQQAIEQIVVTEKTYHIDMNKTMISALALLPTDVARSLIVKILEQASHGYLLAHLNLIRLAFSDYIEGYEALFASVFKKLFEDMAFEIQRTTTISYAEKQQLDYKPIQSFDRGSIVDLIYVFGHLDIAVGESMVQLLLAHPKRFPMYPLLMDAALFTVQTENSAVELSRYFAQQCLVYLDACIAQPLDAPTDWTREVTFSCEKAYREHSEDCAAFVTFLGDPSQQTWSFRAAEQRRKFLMELAYHSKSDVIMETIKKGSPHTLQFIKTQASYEKRVVERQRDNQYRLKIMDKIGK
jgi:predicted 2-oxoglutarate/Fe(II)-dependent dioxygenase YbiX